MKMDCFAAKVCLRDRTKILIGGLCISGVVPELLRRCRKLEDGTLPVDTVVGRPHDLQKPDGGQAV